VAGVADEDCFFWFRSGGSTAERYATAMVGLSISNGKAVVVQEARYGCFLCLLIRLLLKSLAGKDVSGGGGTRNIATRESWEVKQIRGGQRGIVGQWAGTVYLLC
jgi:hypothetical protein